MGFIDEVRDRFGVEPICCLLTEHGVKIAPSGYYAFKKRAPSARAVRDAELKTVIERVFFDRMKGRGLAGVRKMWHLLARDSVVVARCAVERLMRELGPQGARRGRIHLRTVSVVPTSSSVATDRIASHSEARSARHSTNIRTARSRSSGG